MDESGQGTKRAVIVAIAHPLEVQAGTHITEVFSSKSQFLGYCSHISYAVLPMLRQCPKALGEDDAIVLEWMMKDC
jgi:hypothetical protein